MPCESYREALIEAAAGGLELQGELRAHVEVCGPCRALFAEERALFASIDSGLQIAANTEVPPSLLPRVRMQLNDEDVPRRSWSPAWTAIAAVTALVAVTLLVRDLKRVGVGPDSTQSPVANNIPGVESTPMTHPYEMATRAARSKPIRSVNAASVQQVSVLIPAGQKQAVDAFLAGLQQGKMKPDVLLAEKPEQPLQDLQVSPLAISPIEVKPLANVSGEAPPESENARP